MIHIEAIAFLWPHGRLRGLTPGLPVGRQLAPHAAPTDRLLLHAGHMERGPHSGKAR